MKEFLRSRTWFAILTALVALLAIESLATGDTLAGVLFVIAALAVGYRTAMWHRLRRAREERDAAE